MASERIQRRIDLLLDEADEAVARSDWTAVRDRAQNVLRLDPANQDALSYLAAADRDIENAGSPPSPPASAYPEKQAETPPAEPPDTAPGTPDAERRQLTVMFCDLQGSTALSQRLDPEELRDVIRGYQNVCAGAVGRFEGHIAKYLGDGLLVYFGYPQAHEDDPQRAVRAGLAILEDMGHLNDRLDSEKNLALSVRIGVHTGLVVAGEMGGGDTVEALAIVGETPNVAARLQEVAEPNSVVISNVTASLIHGYFQCQDLGSHELKGISEPMDLFAVLSESGAQTPFDVASAAQLTPMVGREQELGLLLDRWEQAKEGLGQVVLLSGEAGIGKSRSIDAVTERLAGEPYTLRRLRCSAYHQNSALHPILEYLEGWLEFGREDSAEERLGRLETALAKVEFPSVDAAPLIAGLLSLTITDQVRAIVMDPEDQRERTLELLVALMLDTPADQPVFLVVEDLHWADPSTIAVLGLLLDQVPTTKALVLLSYRPEFTPTWPSRAYVTPIMLSRLTRRLAGEMVDRLTGGKHLPEEVFNQVASKSDGIPLFVEELTRMVCETGLLRELDDRYELTGPLTPLAIPATLQDALTARLDRLGEAREVIQLGAVMGREITYELMRSVSPLQEPVLRNHLDYLVEREFLYQKGSPPDAAYVFKHALVQDAAYESLLLSSRKQYHQRVAQVLEQQFPDTVDTQPELVAHHYVEAGLAGQAIPFWQQAGERALATDANQEAVDHYERALAAMDGRPMDVEMAGALFGLGKSQIATSQSRGMQPAVDNVMRAFNYYVDAGDIARAVAIAEHPFPTGSFILDDVRSLVTRALALVDDDSHESGRLAARVGMYLGRTRRDYDGAQASFDRAIEIARREGDVDLELLTLANRAEVDLFHLQVEKCQAYVRGAIDSTGIVDNLQAQVQARQRAVLASIIAGDTELATRYASEGIDLAERLGHRWWLATTLWGSQEVRWSPN